MPSRQACLLLAATFIPGIAAAQAIQPAPLRHAELTFAMRATKVNDFVGRVDSVRGEFRGTDLANVTGSIEFQVRHMRTGIGLRDTHMRNAMRADSFPTVRLELTSVQVGATHGDSTEVVLTGTLTIHGVSREVRAPGAVVRRAGQVGVFSSFPVDMREYGIVPPTRFLGAVKVHPVTTIGVRLVFGG